MANAVLLDSFRKRIAAHMAGKEVLKPIAFMAFGDQGFTYDPETDTHAAVPPSAKQTELNHEVLRKPVIAVYQEDEFSVTAKGQVANGEIIGVNLSEAALCDTDGNLLAIRNFAPKVKENDEMYDISIRLRF